MINSFGKREIVALLYIGMLFVVACLLFPMVSLEGRLCSVIMVLQGHLVTILH